MNCKKSSLNLCCSVLLLGLVSLNLSAQTLTPVAVRRDVSSVTASVTSNQVRFAAASDVVQIRLTLYGANGVTLYDSQFMLGNLLDWRGLDQQGQQLSDGLYQAVITLKDSAGQPAQRRAWLRLQGGTLEILPPENTPDGISITNPLDNIDRQDFISVAAPDSASAMTRLAHNGEEGQVLVGRGALSFRGGNFWLGQDKELMRLTPEGHLNVAGAIRTSEGIVFPDGSIQRTAARSEATGNNDTVAATTSARSLPGPREVMSPNALATTFVNDDLLVNGNFTFSGGGVRDINMQANTGALRFYPASSLGFSPAGAAIQFWGNGSGAPGQLFLDTGAHNSAALILRSAISGGTISERMRITAGGLVGINQPTPSRQLEVRSFTSVDTAIRGESFASNGFGNGVVGVAHVGSFPFGVWGISARDADSPNAFAGVFDGFVAVNGTLSKSAGSFKIDHPLAPDTKYLSHSFVESPDMKNIYDGTVTTDGQGFATVTMPNWFEALNSDFRYQLTVIGQFAQAIVAQELSGNQFKIQTSLPNVKVSWQVTGIRQDAYAKKHRIPVEEDKPKLEQGSYLHPELFGKAEEMGVQWKRRAVEMARMKAEREKHAQESAAAPQSPTSTPEKP